MRSPSVHLNDFLIWKNLFSWLPNYFSGYSILGNPRVLHGIVLRVLSSPKIGAVPSIPYYGGPVLFLCARAWVSFFFLSWWYPCLSWNAVISQEKTTETALLRVVNDILMKMNSQEVTLLVMLDLSAAFDTVNHDILTKRLHEELRIADLALRWFESYLWWPMCAIGKRCRARVNQYFFLQ